MPQRCGNCNASHPITVKDDTGKLATVGQCRFNPPQVIPSPHGPVAAWPIINPAENFCLQWHPKKGWNEDGEREDQPRFTPLITQ